jgi:glutathione synthase/RimK-type ligase-like ATP-grasp enzyme
MKIGIAVGFGDPDGTWMRYKKACEALNIDNVVIDIISCNWLDNINKEKDIIDGLLVGPPCQNIEEYDIYMERLYFINNEIGIPIYPSYNELKLYENKRYCTSWLKYHNYLLPDTYVFTNKKQALDYVKKAQYPIVIKATIGAGASAVHIIKKRLYAKWIIHQAFGIHRLLSWGYVSWVRYKKTPLYIPLIGSSMKHYIIVQKYIPIKWEWRIIKIGESYFGHQKLLKGNYASGSDRVGWVDPPKHLFDLIRDICQKGNFNSMAMDVFESIDGQFYINELQSMFGSYKNSQMYINGKPGRYIYKEGQYIFEEGYFNIYGSCLLRVENFISILRQNNVDI